jgi:hypothetical protein
MSQSWMAKCRRYLFPLSQETAWSPKMSTGSPQRGQGLPASSSSKMFIPRYQRNSSLNWPGGQALPKAGAGGTVSQPVALGPSWKERRMVSRLDAEFTSARLRRAYRRLAQYFWEHWTGVNPSVVSVDSQEDRGSASGPNLSRIAVMVATAPEGGHADSGFSNASASWPWSTHWRIAESRAGRALSVTVLTPRPPRERGSVAWFQFWSERCEDPRMACMHDRRAWSARTRSSVHAEVLQVRRRKFKRQALTLVRRRAIWIWGSGMRRRLAHTFSSFSTVAANSLTRYVGLPGGCKGQPRMVTPDVGVQGTWRTRDAALCGGRSGRPVAVPGPHIEVLGAEMTHPTVAKAGVRMARASLIWGRVPTMVPSSKYHRFQCSGVPPVGLAWCANVKPTDTFSMA